MKESLRIAAANVQALRVNSGLTQSEFGELHQSNQKAVWTYENGKAGPGQAFLLSMSRKYGFDPELIFTLKFKVSSDGKITNIPKTRSEIQLLKFELANTMDEFNESMKAFTKKMASIQQRLQKIENKQSR